MIENKKVTAVILAAGSSTRFGKTTNKNLEVIHGKTVLSYSIQAFSQNKYIDDIIITAKETDMTTIHDILNKEKLNKNIKIVHYLRINICFNPYFWSDISFYIFLILIIFYFL